MKPIVSIPAAGWLVLFMVSAAAAQPATAPESQPASEPAGTLAPFYGFGPMEILKLEWATGEPILLDVNGDALTDMVVVNNTKSRIDLLLQKADFDPERIDPAEVNDDDVNDRFGREESWRFKRVGYDLTVAAGALVATDLTGDGRADLAFTARDGLRVAFQDEPTASTASAPATRTGGPRQPLWQPAIKIDMPNLAKGEQTLAAGDLDGDGRTDLAALAGDGVFLIRQQSDGSLATPEKLYSGAEQLQRVYVADLDGDGHGDLALLTGDAEYPVRVRFQDAQGRLGPECRYKIPEPLFLTFTAMGARAQRCALSVSRQSGRVELSALADEPRQRDLPVLTYALPATERAELRDVTLADVDGDALSDVVASDPASAEFLLLRADANAGLMPPKRLPGLAEMSKLVAVDVDATGRQAVIVLSAKEKTIGLSRWDQGRLSFPATLSLLGEPVAMDVADVDDDGAPDLWYVARGPDKSKFYLRTLLSVGRPDEQAGPELLLERMEDKPRDLRAADIDHDGRTDALILPAFGAAILVRQEQPGQFTQVDKRDSQTGLVANVEPKALSLAPLGPGGSPAALLTQKTFARAVIFTPDKGWQAVDQYHAVSDRAALACSACFQLPGRSRPSIVLYDGGRGRLGILAPEEGGTTYRVEREIEVGNVPARKILMGRFGGASQAGLLLAGTRTLVLVPVGGHTRRFRQLASYEPRIKSVRYGHAAVGDVNGDGLEEIVLCDQGRGQLHVLAFNAAGEPVTGTLFKVFEQPRSIERERFGDRGQGREGQPRSVTLGDVTGDGKIDLVVRVHDRILIYPQD